MQEKTNSILVSTLLSLYANSLSSTLDGQMVVLEGFYSDNYGKLYGRYFYDEILDKDKSHKITAQFTESLKTKLNSGSYYQFQGFIQKAQSIDNDSRLKVFFRVTKILKHEEKVQIVSKVEYDILRARFDRDFPIIQDILLNKIEREQKPIIDIITGVQSTSHEDYSNQLHDKEYYNIRHHKCNLSSKDAILEFLNSYNFADSDLLVIIRGGGSGLEVFNEIELCKRAIELPIPFVTGLGHDEDKTLLQRVSDKAFSTPTAVGVFLQKVVSSHKERLRLVSNKDLEMERFKKQVESEKLLLTSRIESQKKSYNLVLLIIAILIVIIVVITYTL
ncbi:exodeoxyribonuclease VII large subunit [Mariniflexile soesokkakense]|uniref:Exodeoxyribonuclease VII large subunit n=1 Tax=Mariniflexile soesokkakense TaxID=1343160 RepID=A0ABV0AH03_9FLAO